KAIRIIRATEEESEVVPNLMIGFGIDQIQAEYVAEIKLRHLNREYILKRTQDIEQLKDEIADMEAILKSRSRVNTIIIDELCQVIKKYGQPRKTTIVYAADLEETAVDLDEPVADYPCTFFFTAEGYFKKITPQSLRMSGEQKLKEGDRMAQTVEGSNVCELLFFTDKATVYKAKASDFADTKASVMGDYIPAKLGFEEGESAAFMVVTTDYKGYLLFSFENGKAAKIELKAYETKTNRRRLIAAYGDKSPLVSICQLAQDAEVLFASTAGRYLLVDTGAIPLKATRSTIGVQVMTLRGAHRLQAAELYHEGRFVKPSHYRKRSIPAAGVTISSEDAGEQLTFD
ncbi:MAG: topoisomerase IV, partial [Clostridia bacterium]|nr:topoisomerase IV [Clostridia bacterium]